MPLFNRIQDASGAWMYADPKEHEFVFSCQIKPCVDIPAIDSFIEDRERNGLSDEQAEQLRYERMMAFSAYANKDYSLSETRALALYRACLYAGLWASSVPLARAGDKSNKAQAQRAKRPRGVKTDYGETVSEVIGRLATLPELADQSAKELWMRFYGELAKGGLSPESDESATEPQKWRIDYCSDQRASGYSHITFGAFETQVSKYRTGRKSL